MGKAEKRSKEPVGGASTAPPTVPQTTSALKADALLGHKIRVLIYNLLNITKDPSSAKRLNATIDEHYISTPYFTAPEAEALKSATVDVEINSHLMPDESSGAESIPGKSLHDALCALLQNFLERRTMPGLVGLTIWRLFLRLFLEWRR
ncbi:uncharacterized protein MAM_05060 [Metarhizium album ARSEF 1941]|uniref:Uncharacterized protein n=1 Tax=Metarhizium album (strain ARSEF 1941) TaxID=1081103 RepID=A0A0B2WLL2_METAS|nr:uncharacterized protein MAM_05060 [Metarhizium album ARSEF 1941]KHN96951.1 hypothetical protein MAM_05060 [Metarhizium album ARSEF 1941]